MSKAADFQKLYRSGGSGRLLTGGGGSRSSLLLSILLVMSVCLGVSGATKVHWYIPEPEAMRLDFPITSKCHCDKTRNSVVYGSGVIICRTSRWCVTVLR